MTMLRPTPRQDALERTYWNYVARHELRLQCCTDCNRYRYPPAPACPDCGETNAEWRPLTGKGHVVAWTIFHRSYFPNLPTPYAVVSVQTDEGPLLVGNLIGASPSIGLPVQALFEETRFDDCTTGSICQWQPLAAFHSSSTEHHNEPHSNL